MQAVYVPPRLTPLKFVEAAAAMRFALTDAGVGPTDATLSLALAKTALETGRWQSIWNSNYGNIKAGEQYQGMYTCITLNEVLGGKVVWFAPEGQLVAGRGSSIVEPKVQVPPGHPQTRMRAYVNEYDGAQSYVEFIAAGRYAEAWRRLLAGDAVGFVHALKQKGYFTADEAAYTRGVVSLQSEMLKKLNGLAHQEIDLEHRDYTSLRTVQVMNHALADEYERVRKGFNGGAAVLADEDDLTVPPPEPESEPNA